MKRDKYDKVVSDLVRLQNRHTCEHCKKVQERAECAHIFGRRHANTRYDLDNLLCLCHRCHRYFTENPVFFFDWLNIYIGEEKLDRLRLKAWSVKKWKKGEKEDLYQQHRKKLKEVENLV